MIGIQCRLDGCKRFPDNCMLNQIYHPRSTQTLQISNTTLNIRTKSFWEPSWVDLGHEMVSRREWGWEDKNITAKSRGRSSWEENMKWWWLQKSNFSETGFARFIFSFALLWYYFSTIFFIVYKSFFSLQPIFDLSTIHCTLFGNRLVIWNALNREINFYPRKYTEI